MIYATNALIFFIGVFVAFIFSFTPSCRGAVKIFVLSGFKASASRRRFGGFLCVFVSLCFNLNAQRRDVSLNNDWLTSLSTATTWKKVNIPHNWDDYYGYRRLIHGNLHGDAIYKKNFIVKQSKQGKRFFLFFEGVSSYAVVYVNNKLVGSHAGGRTTFTLDITDAVKTDGSQNNLSVKASHPFNIQNLPWVCGACSDDRGFSEGSQPMGIFRPAHLIITNDVRIEPFGVHAWADIKDGMIKLFVNTTVKNYSARNRNIKITHLLVDAIGNSATNFYASGDIRTNHSVILPANLRITQDPYIKLWSTDNPYLYKIISTVTENGHIIDRTETDFGFRTINWKTTSHQFLLNNNPVFINGIAEYEHLLGQSHAFSNEQIIARMKWIQAAGFNAFRDAHQPHNLLYGKLCDEKGILWWTQFSAHIWYDTKVFRENFKTLLKEWVIERRNDPALILWGLQNESKLPKDFAAECTALIRSLDPTASSQRPVTTCNGGEGTDWDVPQNWTGTYGGNPATYAADVKRQVLIGEYGAWRTIDLHTEGGFVQNGILSEDRMVQLMEQKIRLAESVKDSSAGQFFWLLSSHDNPGRVQGGEGVRELDRVGPVNYKGLLTPWEEPTDVFYMFRSNYASKEKEPMVYIVSHTWPGRWMKPGVKDSVCVYSNCDEVELFNDIDNASLGKQKRNGIGTHFQWDKANIQYNVLYAVGYVNGIPVARDTILLNHLPSSPNYNKLFDNVQPITQPQAGYNYIYRVNCGGAEFKDENGHWWSADKALPSLNLLHNIYGSSSWTEDFSGMPAFFASQRRIFEPIKGTKDWQLFQDFRYGKDKLKYEFPLPDGEYLVELYFTEPWLGVGGGMNAKAMRLFDVAINGTTVLKDIDIWSEAGSNTALKKTVKARVSGGLLIISFPQTKAGEAVISAIAIASLDKQIKPAPSASLITGIDCSHCSQTSWLDIGNKQYADAAIQFNSLPANLFGADWLQFAKKSKIDKVSFLVTEDADVFVGIKKGSPIPVVLKEFENTTTEIITDEDNGMNYTVYRKRFLKNSPVELRVDNSCLVVLLPVTGMQPAYDLKPVTAYRTNVAIAGEGVQKEQFAGRECAVIKTKNQVMVEWPVQTGVADIYSITLKYFYGKEQPLKGKLQLIGTGNSMMQEEPVSFTFTREGKWNQFTINTGSMINAGNYTVKLVVENGEGLSISGIEIQ